MDALIRREIFDQSQNFPQTFIQAEEFAKTSFSPVELIYVLVVWRLIELSIIID